MPHNAEMIGLATFTLLERILGELEQVRPGSTSRIVNSTIAASQQELAANPNGNSAAIIGVLTDLKKGLGV